MRLPATSSGSDSVWEEVVVKYCDVVHAEKDMTGEEREEAISRELSLYLGPLRPLQGKVIPRLYGAWRRDDIVVMVLEDVGRACGGPGFKLTALAYEDRSVSDSSLAAATRITDIFSIMIKHLYDSLHDAGVIHNDSTPWHITRKNSGYRLIDFDRAIQLAGGQEKQYFRRAQEEMGSVRCMLGF